MQHEGLYIISVAARLLEMHQQTLRKYERAGFVIPQRTAGRLRLYSVEDVQRLRQIKYLVDELGVNFRGLELLLDLSHRLTRLHGLMTPERTPAEIELLRKELAAALELLGLDAALLEATAEAAQAERRAGQEG